MNIINVLNKASCFKRHGTLHILTGRGRKHISHLTETVTTVISDSTVRSSSVWAMSKDVPYAFIWEIHREVMKCFPYKISHTYNYVIVMSKPTWTLLWSLQLTWKLFMLGLGSDEGHFYLHSPVNTHNCVCSERHIWESRILACFSRYPCSHQKLLFGEDSHRPSFWVRNFLKKTEANGLVTCSFARSKYHIVLLNFVILELQQHRCLQSTVFL